MAQISLKDANTFHLRIDRHSLYIPANATGIRTLLRILRKRETASDKRIGTEASPTQWQVEQWLAADRAAQAAKPTIVEGIDVNNLNLDL